LIPEKGGSEIVEENRGNVWFKWAIVVFENEYEISL
jgi:hypothetical protein